MNKSDLVARIVDDTGLTKEKANEVVGVIGKAITEAMVFGDGASFVGFGTFKVNERKARTGRNPQTGETLKIAAKKIPTFKAGKLLKEAVN